MNGNRSPADPADSVDDTDTVRVECKVGRRVADVDVDWTTGAVFEFDTVEDARAWIVQQNHRVPGTLFLAEAPDAGGHLSVDYHAKYAGPR